MTTCARPSSSRDKLKASNPAETLEITWRIRHELAQLSEALLVLNPENRLQPIDAALSRGRREGS